MVSLPKGFVLGAATAAYQVEGATKEDGKGRVMWDDFLEKQGRFSPDPAADFYHQYPVDLELCKKFGVKAIRVSIAWSRIFPEGFGRIEKRGVAFYHRLFQECKKQGVEPFVTLHHFDSPEAIYKSGDWLNSENIQHFVDYAKFCFKEYQDEVHYWITINEPTSLSFQQYVGGTFPPAEKYNFTKCFQAEHDLMLAHARVVNLFKQEKIPGEIGIVHALNTMYPATDSPADQHAMELQDNLENGMYLDGTLAGKYSPKSIKWMNEVLDANNQAHIELPKSQLEELQEAAKQLDFVGVNYYFCKFIQYADGPSEVIHNGTGKKGSSVSQLHGIGREVRKAEIPTTDWDWIIYPKGMYDMLTRINDNYPLVKKMYVTENGLGYKDKFVDEQTPVDDQPRIDYVEAHLEMIEKAIEHGANVQGYFIWSLQDQFSWTNGYSKRYGLFYVDFKTQKRYPKKSAYWYKEVSDSIPE